MPQLESADIIIGDPKYNAGKDYGEQVNDKMPWSEYVEWLSRVIDESEKTTRSMVFFSLSVRGLVEISRVRPPRWICSWHKPTSFSHRVGGTCFLPHWEPFVVYGKTWGAGGRVMNFALSDVFVNNTAKAKGSGHPCPKPVNLYVNLIEKMPYQEILDPFLGSGTTAVACERLGRKWIGIEIEEKFCEIAAKRIDAENRQLKLFVGT